MGIKAILKKNTPEIRQRIKDMGISCTDSNFPILCYFELSNSVTWGSSDVGYDCGENEELFFYLLSLETRNDSELKQTLSGVQRSYNQLKSDYNEMVKRYYDYYGKYESLNCNIKESLDLIKSENDLIKEIQQLQEKIDKLEKENKSLKKKCDE